jgi:tetratricopeptide (TPR) repeat protein
LHALNPAARSYLASRDPAGAKAALRRGFELQPDSPIPYRELTAFLLELDRAGEAIEICRQGLGRFPQDLPLQHTLARAVALVGDTEEAIGLYEDILSTRPDLDDAAAELARLLAARDREGSRRRAVEIVRRLEFNRPSDPRVLDAMGWVYFQTGDPDRARTLLEAAARGAPDEPDVHFHLAAVYARLDETDLAREHVQVALDSGKPFAENLQAQRLLEEIRAAEER